MDQSQRRDCSTCKECLLLAPSHQELRQGMSATITCCLHPKARVRMSDGVYPRLAVYVRQSKSLCGPEGRWWVEDAPSVSPDYKPSAKRKLEGEKVIYVKPPRTPYQVRGKS